MPDLEFFVVAESIAVDQDTNRLSVFNVIEELAPGRPGVPVLPSLVAVSAWNLADDEQQGAHLQASINIAKPNGETIGPYAVNFDGQTFRHRISHRFEQFAFDQPGDWVFEVSMNGARAATHKVTVNAGPEA